MRPDKMPDGGKFRAKAAAALNAQAGLWGDGDMLCVQLNTSGEIIVAATLADAEGVIWTPEGRRSDIANYKSVMGGKHYTVFTFAEFVEVEVGNTSPALSAGDSVWATTGGDVVVEGSAATGAIYIGSVLDGGSRMLVNINGKPAHA